MDYKDLFEDIGDTLANDFSFTDFQEPTPPTLEPWWNETAIKFDLDEEFHEKMERLNNPILRADIRANIW